MAVMVDMETLEQIQQTLSEIDRRIPNALRDVFRLYYRVALVPTPKEDDHDDTASFIAAALKPLVTEEGDDLPAELDDAPLEREDVDDRPAGCHDAPRALGMDMASCYVPDHNEDAHFGHPDAGVIGVADGVSWYRAKGVDAAAFSRALMRNAFVEAELAFTEGVTPVCPYTLLERAYEETVRSKKPGASTAVILSLAGRALKWAYIGDSAFAVFRDGKIVHRSLTQQHYFNCPYQLCTAAEGGNSITDAEVGDMPVREGDVVVVGTDGLFDNVFDVELERIVQMGTKLGLSPQNMADIIAGFAYEMSERKLKHTPFSIESWMSIKKERGERVYGGKSDDITVVVAFLVSSDS